MSRKLSPTARAGRQEPPELLASSGFLLARLGGESSKRFARALAHQGLRMSHYGVLMTLAGEGQLSQTALGRRIGVDPRNLVAVLDYLEKRQVAARDSDPADRRRHGVRLTTRGMAMLARLRRIGAALEEEMLFPLDESERADLQGLLLKLFRGLEDESHPQRRGRLRRNRAVG